jgi:Family of unknown function (DUF6011)
MSFSNLTDAKTFAFAGHALITLESRKSGDHHTYKICQCEDKETKKLKDLFFVSHLVEGSADEGRFAYLGVVEKGAFRLTKKSSATPEAASVKAFSFFMALKELHPLLLVHHENKCGRCGRTLTVPESINLGIGPECASKMGMA